MMAASSKSNMSVEEQIAIFRNDLTSDIESRRDRRDVVKWLAEASGSIRQAAAKFDERRIEFIPPTTRDELASTLSSKDIARELASRKPQTMVTPNSGRRIGSRSDNRYNADIGRPKMNLSVSEIDVVTIALSIKTAIADALSNT